MSYLRRLALASLSYLATGCTGGTSTTTGAGDATDGDPGTGASGSSGETTSGTTTAASTGAGTTADVEPTTSTSSPTITSETASTSSSTGDTGDPAHAWIVPMLGAANNQAHSVVLSPQGDVVLGGLFAGVMDFGGQPFVSAGDFDLFVAKISRQGELVWAHGVGGPELEHEASVAVDADGGVLLAGEFSATVQLPGLPALASEGMNDLLLVKYTAAGEPVWARSFGSARSEMEPRVTFDPQGDIFLVADFEDTVTFGGELLVAQDDWDMAVVKLDGLGQHLWSKSFGGPASDGAVDLVTDADGDLVLTGEFANSIDFGGGLFSDGGGFVVKLDGGDGSHVWSRALQNGTTVSGYAARFDASGGLLVTGYFHDSIDLGDGPLQSVDSADVFVVALDGDDGEPLWGRTYGGPNVDVGWGVAAGPAGDWTISGSFNQSIDLGGGLLTKDVYNGCGYLAGLAGADAAHRWSIKVCAESSAGVHRLAAYPEGDVVFTGDFIGALEIFDAQAVTADPDGFVAYVPIELLEP